RSFDQQIGDCRRMASLIAERLDDERPVLVVGLRTSGSYLAPLCVAFLTVAGHADSDALTIRPGQRLLPAEKARLARGLEMGATLCLVDDPPRTGAQLAEAADALERRGFAAESKLLVVPLLGPAES